ncbi:hypothetical protein Dimus_028043 [Dionaea muscipula]
MGIDPDEELLAEVDRELSNRDVLEDGLHLMNDDEDSRQGVILRDNIAAQMWNAYTASGFGWSVDTKLFEAEPEVWKVKIELLELYTKDRATGERAMTAKEKAHQWSNQQNQSQFDTIDDIDQMCSCLKAREGSSKGKKRKGKLDDSVDVFLKRGFETIVEAFKEGNAILREIRPRVYSAEEVFTGLQNIGVEQRLLLKWQFLELMTTGIIGKMSLLEIY